MDEKTVDNKSKILIILVIVLFAMLIGMIIFKYKNSKVNIDQNKNIINQEEIKQETTKKEDRNETRPNNPKPNQPNTNERNKKLNRNSSISDIKIEPNKINVYFFWGDGCPHCAQEFEFLDRHYKKYQKYCNIYAFEVWNNVENAELMNRFGKILNEEIDGVPLTIIGQEKVIGFGETTGDKIDSLIKAEYEKEEHYDIYNEIKEEKNEK